MFTLGKDKTFETFVKANVFKLKVENDPRIIMGWKSFCKRINNFLTFPLRNQSVHIIFLFQFSSLFYINIYLFLSIFNYLSHKLLNLVIPRSAATGLDLLIANQTLFMLIRYDFFNVCYLIKFKQTTTSLLLLADQMTLFGETRKFLQIAIHIMF